MLADFLFGFAVGVVATLVVLAVAVYAMIKMFERKIRSKYSWLFAAAAAIDVGSGLLKNSGLLKRTTAKKGRRRRKR